MKLNRSKIVTVVIVALLAITAFILFKNGGAWTVGQENSHPNTPEPAAIQSVYTHPSPKFSFEYPKGFSVGSFPEGENSETILVHAASGENTIQILISSFDEDIVLTKKRILKDAPDTEIKNEKEITIGKNAKGLMFESTNSSGPTTEVWFVFGGHLYQITAPTTGGKRSALEEDLATGKVRPWGAEDIFDDIIKSWQWNR